MSKIKKIAAIVAAVIVVGGIGASTTFSVLAYKEAKDDGKTATPVAAVENKGDKDEAVSADEIAKKIYEKFKAYGEGEKKDEDGNIIIGGEYVIKDYKYIADAYLSGDTSKLEEKDVAVVDELKKIIPEIWTDDMTQYEKELAVHDWMAENISFDDGSLSAIPSASENCNQPYGALVNRKCVCVGFATTFQMFMYILGVDDCQVVHDTGYGHSWDLVKLDDGEYYFVDVTFDASEGSVSHVNFNVSSETFAMSHDWEQAAYPTAEGTKYNYAVANAETFKTIYDVPKKLYEVIENSERKVTEFYFTISDADTMYGGEYLMGQIEAAYGGSETMYIEHSTVNVGGKLYYGMVVTRWDVEEPDEPIIPEGEDNTDYGKLDEKITDVFGEISDYGYGEGFDEDMNMGAMG